MFVTFFIDNCFFLDIILLREEKSMFDISSKTNKYGDLAYVETNDEKKENLDYRFKRKFSIELPEIKSSINLSYEYDSLANSTVLEVLK